MSKTDELKVDISYCASSFLMHRTIIDHSRCFSLKFPPRFWSRPRTPTQVRDSHELETALRHSAEEAFADGRGALALSGGIDSAILARMAPAGTKAYTFKCTVPGVEVTDETPQAARYAEACGLDHEIIEITWGDVEGLAPQLMRHKGAPIHSIETQIAKASLRARAAGYERLVFGESADCNYGGLSNIFSRDWAFGQYVERYSYVMPYKALRHSILELNPFIESIKPDGRIDILKHFREHFLPESMGSYDNATSWAGIDLVAPYADTWLDAPLDYARIRAGENKYLVREVFARLYPGWEVPAKIPMPRPTDEWFARWEGPARPEFWPGCIEGMTGDQKWLLWSLERFLDLVDEAEGSAPAQA